MLTWNLLETIIKQSQSGLKNGTFEYPSGARYPLANSDFDFMQKVDNLCRHFALHQNWPQPLDELEQRAVAQRTFFALTVIQTVRALHESDSPVNVKPPVDDQRNMLEWLLIWTWKMGGPRLMNDMNQMVGTAIKYATMATGSRVGNEDALDDAAFIG